MNTSMMAFILTSIAGLSTLIGIIPIFFKRVQPQKIIVASLSFAAGVMFTISLTDLIPESFELLTKKYLGFPASVMLGIAFVVGVIFSIIIDRYVPDEKAVAKNHKKLYKVGIVSMLAIVLHNIPEGMATFISTTNDFSLGLSLAIAISLHNIPEGISISVPIYYSTGSKKKAIFYTFLSGLSEPFGGLLAYFFLRPFMSDTLMGVLLAFIAGIMISITCYELLPNARQYKQKKTAVVSFLVGALIMIITHAI